MRILCIFPTTAFFERHNCLAMSVGRSPLFIMWIRSSVCSCVQCSLIRLSLDCGSCQPCNRGTGLGNRPVTTHSASSCPRISGEKTSPSEWHALHCNMASSASKLCLMNPLPLQLGHIVLPSDIDDEVSFRRNNAPHDGIVVRVVTKRFQ